MFGYDLKMMARGVSAVALLGVLLFLGKIYLDKMEFEESQIEIKADVDEAVGIKAVIERIQKERIKKEMEDDKTYEINTTIGIHTITI